MPTKKVDPLQSDFPKLSQPALRALDFGGYKRLEDLTKATESEVAKLHGMGPKGMRDLNAALAEKGWSFAKK